MDLTPRQQQRYDRLRKDHFPAWEAKQLVNEKLTDPAMVALRKERKEWYRTERKLGTTKAEYNRKIANYYKANELIDAKGRKQPKELVKAFRDRPQVRAELHKVEKRARREPLRAGADSDYQERYRILIKAGFLDFEARELAAMKHISPDKRKATFNSETWQTAIERHRAYINQMTNKAAQRIIQEAKSKGLSLSRADIMRQAKKRVKDMLLNLRAMGKLKPYDWLKLEYKPKRKPKRYETDKKEKATKNVRRASYGLAAGKKPGVMFWD